MPELTLRHEIETDAETYWTQLSWNAGLNKKLYVEHLGFPVWQLVDEQDHAEKKSRRVRVEPPLGELPAVLKKMAGERFSYLEEGTLDKQTWTYAFTIVPSVMSEKARIFGTVRSEPLGDKRFVRHLHVQADVKVMLVGSMVEERLLTQLRASYDKSALFINAHIREHGLGA